MKKALIIIDYVYDFVADDGRLTAGKPAQDIEENIVTLTEQFAEQGDFVADMIDLHDETDEYNKEKSMFPAHCFDAKGRTLYGAVQGAVDAVPMSQRISLAKHRYSAFYSTALDMKLKERKVSEVHLVGACTDICVLHTAIDAYNLGYEIVVHKDAVASFNQSGHDMALEHFKNVLAAKVI